MSDEMRGRLGKKNLVSPHIDLARIMLYLVKLLRVLKYGDAFTYVKKEDFPVLLEVYGEFYKRNFNIELCKRVLPDLVIRVSSLNAQRKENTCKPVVVDDGMRTGVVRQPASVAGGSGTHACQMSKNRKRAKKSSKRDC